MNIITRPKILIRKARICDLDEIFMMWYEFIKHTEMKTKHKSQKLKKNFKSLGKPHLKKQIYSKNSLVLVIEYNSRLIGYGVFQVSKFPPIYLIGKEIGVCDIFIKKEFRGFGLAKKLLAEGKKWGRKKGLKYSNLQVLFWNKNAIKAYKKAGFRIIRYIMKDY